jgi:predicted Zn-dependent protease
MKLSRRQFNRRLLAGTAYAGFCTCGLTGCSVNPATGQSSFTAFMSPEEEIKTGRAELPKMVQSFGGEYRDARLKRYITDIGMSLAAKTEMPSVPYSFTILNSDIVNAFALPGGPVCVSRGLIALASDEAELAGVIGHELGHITARHSAQRYSQAQAANIGLGVVGLGLSILGAGSAGSSLMNVASVGAQAYLKAYSREHEIEADSLGLRYMTRLGYDPRSMVGFLESLRQHSMLEARMAGLPESTVDETHMTSTHPRTIDRVQRATAQAQSSLPPQPRTGREAYLDHLNGMIFGDDADQGILKGRKFVHPSLRFEFTVPKGFRVANSPQNVVARHPEGAAMVFDGGVSKSGGNMRTYLTREWASQAGLSQIEAITINGQEAATGWAKAHTKKGDAVNLRFLAIAGERSEVFRFLFLTPPAVATRFDEAFKTTTYSFRRLSPSEASNVKPLRMVVVTARAGDTIERLSAAMPYEEFNNDWFRLLNDLAPGQPIPVGKQVKVVAG